MGNIIFALICFIFGVYHFLLGRKYVNQGKDPEGFFIPMYIKQLKRGGIIMILIGVAALLDLFVNLISKNN